MIPVKERALVFQGGGSLGAYEAGAYKALYEFLSKHDETEGKGKRSTFDIIAGTSIGAMNAAVLTSYVAENGILIGSLDHQKQSDVTIQQRNLLYSECQMYFLPLHQYSTTSFLICITLGFDLAMSP
jgi:predicted acylesterase/phospholipase RssA